MTRREIREEIFKLLFEKELTDNNVEKRIEETIKENKIKKEEHIEFLTDGHMKDWEHLKKFF